MSLKYYIPFVYGISTRSNHYLYMLSFMITFVFLILMAILFYNNDFFYILPRYLVGLTALYSVYELGYMFNDTYTVQLETKPTYRLRASELSGVKKNARKLIIIRICVVIIPCLLLLKVLGIKNLIWFAGSLFLLALVFSLHNRIRSKLNLVTIFLVSVLRYTSIPILFIPLDHYPLYLFVLVSMFPVIRTVEYAYIKFDFKWLANYALDLMRVMYYALLFLISMLLVALNEDFMVALALSGYMLFFRLAGYVASHNKRVQAIRSNYLRK